MSHTIILVKAQKVLITGATGTIGSAIAKELAKDGTVLSLHFHKNKKLADILASHLKSNECKLFTIQADLADITQVKHIVKQANVDLSGLDAIVHCAAIFMKTPFEEVSEKEFDNLMNVNFKASFFLAQEASKFMSDGGKMIFFSDTVVQKPYTGYLPYCMAKAGVECLVKGLAKKLAPKIQVNAIAPYLVTRPPFLSDTGWNDLLSKTPSRRASPPEEIAEIVSFLLNASPSLTGQIINVDGGRLLR